MGIRSLSSASISTGAKRSKFWDQSAAVINGAYESIATYTPTGTSFTISGISQAYKHLELRLVYQTGSVADVQLSINGDNGMRLFSLDARTGSGAGYQGGSSTAGGSGLYFQDGMWSASYPEVAHLRFPDYTNTNKLRTFFNVGGQRSNGTASVKWLTSGIYNTTAALTTMTITSTGASFTGGSIFALYGIKG